MHRKPVFPAFAAALAALATGCEWTGTSSSDSWSGSYDAMNFSGSYRSAATLESGSADSSETTVSVREVVGSYNNSTRKYAGHLSHTPVNLASVQIQLGGITFTGDGSGNLTSDYGAGKVSESGAWSVDLDATPTETTGGHQKKVPGEVIDVVSKASSLNNKNLKCTPVVPGSVVISLENGLSFTDNGSQVLVGSESKTGGTIEYSAGSITLQWEENSAYKGYSGIVSASYSYYSNETQNDGVSSLGSGSIVAIYSYGATQNSASMATSSSDITAVTVSQSGQNLSMSTNTGIVMSGKFTAVRETRVASDSGTATYNAQFQVTSAAGHKFVGTLNYDASSGHRTLNGTLTQGKAVYDVQGVGPAF